MLFTVSIFTIIANSAYAENVLSADEAKALFANKTFDGYQEIKEKEFMVYSAADGTHTVHFSSGKVKVGTWSINDEGKHCVELSKLRCTKVISVGDGTYQKIKDNGKHTHTLSNFRDGNQL